MNVTISASSEFQFGTGDGVATVFPLVVAASGFSGSPSIFRNDWQGDQLQYATPRTNLLKYSQDFTQAAWTKTAATVIANATTAPDGTQTADKLVEDTSTAAHNAIQNSGKGGTSGTFFTASIYLKAGERTRAFLRAYQSANVYGLIDVNLATGQITYTQAVNTQTLTSSIQSIGNGWYRVSVSVTSTFSYAWQLVVDVANSTERSAYSINGYAGDGASGLYVWGAQLETGTLATPYIATGNGGVTATDYSIDDAAEVVFAQPPLRGAILSWLGSFNYTPLPEPAPSFARTTIISQYANSPIICQLIENMGQYIDPAADINAFYDLVWNVDTAQGFGLDFWGKVVNVSRQLNIPGGIADFGFKEQAEAQPFGQAPLYLTAPKSTVYALSDTVYRMLILAKALANISDCTAPSLNQLLQNMFAGRGRCYVADLGAMQLQYTFEFALQPYEVAIITQSGALPRPAAVSAKLLQADVTNTFGFSESGVGPIQLTGSPSFFVNDGLGQHQLYMTPRTNLLTYSAQFDNAAWAKTFVTVTANAATAPDGTQTADKLINTTTTNQHSVGHSYSDTAGNLKTFSCYMKAGELNYGALTCWDGKSYFLDVIFDLVNGVIAKDVAGIATIQSVGNGWYRCSVSGAPAQTVSLNCQVRANQGGTSPTENYAGDGSSGIYIWGAQLETGTQATGYIPTTGAAVTVTDISSVDMVNNSVTFGAAPANNGELSWTGSYNDIARQQQVNVAQQALGVGDGVRTTFPICGIPGGNSLQPFGQGTLFNTDTGLLNATV